MAPVGPVAPVPPVAPVGPAGPAGPGVPPGTVATTVRGSWNARPVSWISPVGVAAPKPRATETTFVRSRPVNSDSGIRTLESSSFRAVVPGCGSSAEEYRSLRTVRVVPEASFSVTSATCSVAGGLSGLWKFTPARNVSVRNADTSCPVAPRSTPSVAAPVHVSVSCGVGERFGAAPQPVVVTTRALGAQAVGVAAKPV
ncbi:unannotated protein [freshwater metagenome]|uniref:Unannotated protein n=1 Tax=freshwater metagenome TaxID=449393 RepID=A0A6J7HP74_9ZZZZ